MIARAVKSQNKISFLKTNTTVFLKTNTIVFLKRNTTVFWSCMDCRTDGTECNVSIQGKTPNEFLIWQRQKESNVKGKTGECQRQDKTRE